MTEVFRVPMRSRRDDDIDPSMPRAEAVSWRPAVGAVLGCLLTSTGTALFLIVVSVLIPET